MDKIKKNISEDTFCPDTSPAPARDVSLRPLLPRHTVLAGIGAGLILSIAATFLKLPFLLVWILASLVITPSIGAMTRAQSKKYEKYLTHIEQENRELELLRQEAQADSARKTEFMANMSRELRTPASVIVSLSRLSLRQNIPDALAFHLENILSSGKDVLETANDILDFSKIESGQMAFTEARYSLSSLISDIKETVDSKLKGQNITFLQEIDNTTPNLLWGDEMRLRQILLHMTDSVLEHTKEGTLSLNIQWKKQKDMALLTISVSVSGQNVSGEKTTALRTDLKPLIAKKMAEKMGGSVLPENPEDGKNTFSVTIPQKILQELPTYGEAKSRPRTGLPKAGHRDTALTFPGARVLVIDDSITSLKLLKELLAPYNMKAEYVLHAPECLERNWAKTYDLILLDFFLPELNGGEILRYLQKNPRFRTPVIALGTNAPEETKESFASWGFTDFLAKPIQPEELEHCLRQYLFAFLHTEHGAVPTGSGKIVFTLPPQTEKPTSVQADGPTSIKAEIPKPVPTEMPKSSQTDVDNEILDISLGIQNTAGEESFYIEILELYLSEAQSKKDLLHSYLDAGDMKNYAIQVHALKSTMRSMGAMKAGELAFDLETHSKKEDLEYVRAHHENMIKETELAEENMRRYLSKKDTPG